MCVCIFEGVREREREKAKEIYLRDRVRINHVNVMG